MRGIFFYFSPYRRDGDVGREQLRERIDTTIRSCATPQSATTSRITPTVRFASAAPGLERLWSRFSAASDGITVHIVAKTQRSTFSSSAYVIGGDRTVLVGFVRVTATRCCLGDKQMTVGWHIFVVCAALVLIFRGGSRVVSILITDLRQWLTRIHTFLFAFPKSKCVE